MRTRQELDAEWQRIDDAVTEVDKPADKFGTPFAAWLREIVKEERAFIDRAAQARAIRFANKWERGQWEMDSFRLQTLAKLVASGEVTIPEEP